MKEDEANKKEEVEIGGDDQHYVHFNNLHPVYSFSPSIS